MNTCRKALKSYVPRDLPLWHGAPEQFHLTPSYFGDIVRREMGITPQAFLQTKLIDRAKSLLASQELTINEIAEELGFSYPNHFARLFRQKTGMSPSAFRRQLLKE